MANQANNNGDNKTCIDYFLQDLCKKFYREDLFTFETFPVSMNNIQNPLDKLTRDQKNLLISSVQDIGNYNNEYALLGTEYISLNSQNNKILDRNIYKNYIKLAKDGYLKKKDNCIVCFKIFNDTRTIIFNLFYELSKKPLYT